MKIKIHDIAHARAGDKGHSINISVIAYDQSGYKIIFDYITPELIMETYKHLASGPVKRFELPNLLALNFVIENVISGGVSSSIAHDTHGKSFSSLLLALELE